VAEGDVLQQLGELWRNIQEQPFGRQVALLAIPVVVVALLVLGTLVIWAAASPRISPPPTVVVQAGQPGAPPPTPASPQGAATPASPAPPAAAAAATTVEPAPVAAKPTVLVPTVPPSPTATPSPEPTPVPARSARVINTEGQGANMRRTVSVSAQRVKLLPEGTVVELLGPEERGDGRAWRHVRDADGSTGYVLAEFLQPIQGPPGATPVLPPPQITVDEITAPAARGKEATIAITTRPGVRCELRVLIFGPATLPREGLEPMQADDEGHCSWTWTVPEEVVPGTWRYRIIVGEGESSSSREVSFVVT
jgi:hypothetical protein